VQIILLTFGLNSSESSLGLFFRNVLFVQVYELLQ